MFFAIHELCLILSDASILPFYSYNKKMIVTTEHVTFCELWCELVDPFPRLCPVESPNVPSK